MAMVTTKRHELGMTNIVASHAIRAIVVYPLASPNPGKLCYLSTYQVAANWGALKRRARGIAAGDAPSSTNGAHTLMSTNGDSGLMARTPHL